MYVHILGIIAHPPQGCCYLAVAFKVYDVDRDGFISNGELFLVLKMMVGNNLKVRSPFEFSLPDAELTLRLRTNSYNRSSTRRSWKLISMAMGS